MKPDDANWRYDALPKTGKCEIDNKPIALRITLYGDGPKNLDVLDAEKWLVKAVKEPMTVEKYARAIASLFPNHSVQVVGETDTHGPITCRCVA